MIKNNKENYLKNGIKDWRKIEKKLSVLKKIDIIDKGNYQKDHEYSERKEKGRKKQRKRCVHIYIPIIIVKYIRDSDTKVV